MNMKTLAESYLEKATKRLRVLEILLDEEAFSDVVREAQELGPCLKSSAPDFGKVKS